jgi:transmembrane sensor
MHKIDREAAEWLVRCEDPERPLGAGEQSRWIRWLQRSPRHVQTYFDTAGLYARLDKIDPENRIDVEEWMSGQGAPVVSLGAMRPRHAGHSTVRRWSRRWSLAAAAIALVCTASLIGWQLFSGERYSTGVGQQGTYKLADGSVLKLNTRSSARVDYSTEQRVIELEGEALFTVAPDPARPFLVRTRGATVKALGTRFNVYELPGQVRVAVLEGKVQVQAPANRLALSAGEAAQVSGGRAALQLPANVGAAVAWERQQLVFEDATLAEVVAEFNRYNDSRIHIQGDIGHTTRLSGTFDALYPQSLLLYLTRDQNIVVTERREDVLVRGLPR